MLPLKHASCQYGKKRQNHGIQIKLEFDRERIVQRGEQRILTSACTEYKNFRIDLIGDVFSHMPPGTSTFASWILPLKVRDLNSHRKKASMLDFDYEVSGDEKTNNVKKNNVNVIDERLERGTAVEANYKGKGKWYKGKITYVNSDGTFDIMYNDGDKESRVRKQNVQVYSKKKSSRDRDATITHNNPTIIFTLGAYKLSHATLNKNLQKMANGGDPPFCLDLIARKVGDEGKGKDVLYRKVGDEEKGKSKDVLLCRVATKASLMIASLEVKVAAEAKCVNIKLRKSAIPPSLIAAADARRETSRLRRAILFCRWWFYPVMYSLLCWILLTAPRTIDVLPNTRIVFFHKDIANRTLTNVLVPIPRTRSQAFKLGIVYSKYVTLTNDNMQAPVDNLQNVKSQLLDEAASIIALLDNENERSLFHKLTHKHKASIATLTENDLMSTLQRLESEENHISLLARVTSVFTIVNLMWLVSIVGIGISILPSILTILKPFKLAIVRLCKKVYYKIVEPICRMLHEQCVLEFFAWMVVCQVLIDAYKYYGADAGLYIAITSIMLAVTSMSYSTLLHAASFKHQNNRSDLVYARWGAVTLFPVAIIYQSSLLGYIAVALLYHLIGFSFFCHGMCYYIGFDSNDALERCTISSAFLLIIMFCIKYAIGRSNDVTPFETFENYLLVPFESAVSVLGCIVLYTGLLIMSSKSYKRSRYDRRNKCWIPSPAGYIFRNIMMAVSLSFGFFFGMMLDLSGMYNTACVFGVLWVVYHYSYFHLMERKWDGWILVLIISLIMWRLALWLHLHPNFIIACITSIS